MDAEREAEIRSEHAKQLNGAMWNHGAITYLLTEIDRLRAHVSDQTDAYAGHANRLIEELKRQHAYELHRSTKAFAEANARLEKERDLARESAAGNGGAVDRLIAERDADRERLRELRGILEMHRWDDALAYARAALDGSKEKP